MLKGFLGWEIFGRFLVNQLRIFVGDFWGVFARDFCQPGWGFLVGVFAWGFLAVGSFWDIPIQ